MARETGWMQQPLNRLLGPLVRRLWDVDIAGLENIPSTGPAILCPNHVAFIDSVFTMSAVPRTVLAVGKAEYMDSWKTKFLFPASGMIPLDRSGGEASQAALDQAAAVLDRGDLFLIYPEGTRTRTGYLHKGRTGAARLALRTGAPIIPVGLRGTDAVQPVGQSKPVFKKRVEIRFGRPIDVSRYRDKKDDRLVFRQIIDEVMYEVRELSGQAYVNVYAGDPLPEALANEPLPIDLGECVAPLEGTLARA
jgi:1-acyl-sn-glycerol-3-phosphate acyltransferase